MDDPKQPDFPVKDYVRPNTNWECGRLAEGCPCRIGPSPTGKCRATYECQPKLEKKAGDSKGRWVCTRPNTAGGKCENGPLPDGTCCNPIPKCQPRRKLRSVRKRFTVLVAIATVFLLLIAANSDKFINPGPLSRNHSGETFTVQLANLPEGSTGCAACHEAAQEDIHEWTAKIIQASTGNLSPAKLLNPSPTGSAPMDQNCLACHAGNDFHQPNEAGKFACHSCHVEHETAGEMLSVDSFMCIRCHGSEALMAKSIEMGKDIPAHEFPIIDNAGLHVFQMDRPIDGYTQTIDNFDKSHPEFRIFREEEKDSNALKFNHAVHLVTGKIPLVDGKPLDCTYCHQPDARGAYFQKITYEAQCSACHGLQFDKDTPDLHLPHGDPFYVRSFIRSMNIQYSEFAIDQAGITQEEKLDSFVNGKMANLMSQYDNSGSKLERAIFYADMKGRIEGGGQAPFPGCATCHDLSERENAAPAVAEVAIPDRWLHVGEFHHARHEHMACLDCHSVTKSELTSDINLPTIQNCIKCHSPKGGVNNDCTLCHTYHNKRPTVEAKMPSRVVSP